MVKYFNFKFKYVNYVSESISIWGSPLLKSSEFSQQNYISPTGDSLVYFKIKRGESIQINRKVEIYNPVKSKYPLNNAEAEYYLRDTTLSPINDSIKKLALEVTRNTNSIEEKAYNIFKYLVLNYKYMYPPKSRGAISFIQSQKGDCGEYSFLFTALCRALSIPTRTLVGSWSFGKMKGHVWNEFFQDGKGWIPVDCSMAFISKSKPLEFIGSGLKVLSWKRYFGETEGQRIVFWKDADVELVPKFKEMNNLGEKLNTLDINGEPFYWGGQTLKGNAPYLQPIYIGFDASETYPQRKLTVADVLGKWSVKEKGIQGILYSVQNSLFIIGGTSFLASLWLENIYVEILFKVCFILYSLSFIVRKQNIVLFSILLVLFVLSFYSTISMW